MGAAGLGPRSKLNMLRQNFFGETRICSILHWLVASEVCIVHHAEGLPTTTAPRLSQEFTMKKYLILSTLLIVSTTAFAQGPGTPPPGGGAMMRSPFDRNKPAIAYPDSVQFKAEFKELLPLIRPTPSVAERAETSYLHMWRMLKARGVDSVKGHDTAMAAIDKSQDEKILFNSYREAFTAEELKPIVAFFKTAAGKHYLEVENKLMEGRGPMLDRYIQQTISRAVAPMEKPIERPKPRPGMPGTRPMPGGGTPTPGTPSEPGTAPTPAPPPTPPESH